MTVPAPPELSEPVKLLQKAGFGTALSKLKLRHEHEPPYRPWKREAESENDDGQFKRPKLENHDENACLLQTRASEGSGDEDAICSTEGSSKSHAMKVETLLIAPNIESSKPGLSAFARSEDAAERSPSADGQPLSPFPFGLAADQDPDGKPFHCDVSGCDRKYKKLNGLIYHRQTAHEDTNWSDPKPYKCFLCEKAYRNSNGLAYHLEKGHGAHIAQTRNATQTATATPTPARDTPPTPRPVKTKIAIKRANVSNEVVEKPYVCPYEGCGKSYKNPNGLSYHLNDSKWTSHRKPDGTNVEKRSTTYSCTVPNCGEIHTSAAGLATHVQEAHATDASITSFECAVPNCHRTFQSAFVLAEHIQNAHQDLSRAPIATEGTSANNRPLECPSCMRQFRSQSSLTYHTTTVHHANARRFEQLPEYAEKSLNPPEPSRHAVSNGSPTQTPTSQHITRPDYHHNRYIQTPEQHILPSDPIAASIEATTATQRAKIQHETGFDVRQPHHYLHYHTYSAFYESEYSNRPGFSPVDPQNNPPRRRLSLAYNASHHPVAAHAAEALPGLFQMDPQTQVEGVAA